MDIEAGMPPRQDEMDKEALGPEAGFFPQPKTVCKDMTRGRNPSWKAFKRKV